MAVSCHLSVKFACDEEGCTDYEHVDFATRGSISAAVQDARIRGWMVCRSGDTYCPAHKGSRKKEKN